jgi:hypothetical protein
VTVISGLVGAGGVGVGVGGVGGGGVGLQAVSSRHNNTHFRLHSPDNIPLCITVSSVIPLKT